MKTFLTIVALASVLALAAAVLPDNYVTLSAREKQALQWSQVLESRYNLTELPSAFPQPTDNLTLLGLPEYLAQSFLITGDEMPGTRRRMLLSPFAVVCKVEYRTFKNSTSQFTGLFNTGGIGLIRLALDAIYGPPLGSLFSPTAVLKIYIDGQISRNFQHIKDVIGQGANHNFFLNNMSNIMDKGPNDPQAVMDAFIRTIAILPGDALSRPLNPYTLGLYEQASVNSDGTNVTGAIVAPWEQRLQGHAGLATPADSTNDFRLDLLNVLKEGTVLYDVYAKRSVDAPENELIGEIVLQSECVPSKYGDELIFFRQSREQWRP
ncbi:hypothetical protein BV898_10055 [Hypsibius exemplaris]|uniref:N-acylethanolamine-hydrolyzing acid amidase n=1 Tax=Hypsibius exemplaris TaxID=2072580 RepID=A0A1W0WL05_HYPEX|nr:hypothetical protein BV898_10055 [Hypsibius exemplaris]